MPLPYGSWKALVNGVEGLLFIDPPDAQGIFVGRVFGSTIKGFWNEAAQKIQFSSYAEPGAGAQTVGLPGRLPDHVCYTDQESGIVSNGIKYLKVGKKVSGKYRGADLINVASCVYEGMGGCYDVFRIIKNGNNITFISKEIDEYQKNLINKVYLFGNYKVEFNDKITIADLEYPDEIAGIDESWQKLKKKEIGIHFFITWN